VSLGGLAFRYLWQAARAPACVPLPTALTVGTRQSCPYMVRTLTAPPISHYPGSCIKSSSRFKTSYICDVLVIQIFDSIGLKRELLWKSVAVPATVSLFRFFFNIRLPLFWWFGMGRWKKTSQARRPASTKN